MIVDRDEFYTYHVRPGHRGVVRVSADGKAEALRLRTRKERTMPVSDRGWREIAPQIAASLRRAAAAEPEDDGFAPVPPPAWAGPATGGPMTAQERRIPGLLNEGDYAPIPRGLWEGKP